MGSAHYHAILHTHHETPLFIALTLSPLFLIREIGGAYFTSSLALLADTPHMFTDTAALAIALMAIRIGERPLDTLRTFGYYRFEILAALLISSYFFSSIFMYCMKLTNVYGSQQKFTHKGCS